MWTNPPTPYPSRFLWNLTHEVVVYNLHKESRC